MRPAVEMFMTPIIGVVCFAIILLSWFGGVRYFKGIPAGLIAIAVGSLIAWGSNLFGANYGGMSLEKLSQSFSSFGFSLPLPAFGHIFSGFEFLGVILVTAIPFGIYDLVEALDNVESAAVAGDEFPTTGCLRQTVSSASSVAAWEIPSSTRFTLAIPAGNRWGGASAIQPPRVWS